MIPLRGKLPWIIWYKQMVEHGIRHGIYIPPFESLQKHNTLGGWWNHLPQDIQAKKKNMSGHILSALFNNKCTVPLILLHLTPLFFDNIGNTTPNLMALVPLAIVVADLFALLPNSMTLLKHMHPVMNNLANDYSILYRPHLDIMYVKPTQSTHMPTPMHHPFLPMSVSTMFTPIGIPISMANLHHAIWSYVSYTPFKVILNPDTYGNHSSMIFFSTNFPSIQLLNGAYIMVLIMEFLFYSNVKSTIWLLPLPQLISLNNLLLPLDNMFVLPATHY
jgi:hypothetical protein